MTSFVHKVETQLRRRPSDRGPVRTPRRLPGLNVVLLRLSFCHLLPVCVRVLGLPPSTSLRRSRADACPPRAPPFDVYSFVELMNFWKVPSPRLFPLLLTELLSVTQASEELKRHRRMPGDVCRSGVLCDALHRGVYDETCRRVPGGGNDRDGFRDISGVALRPRAHFMPCRSSFHYCTLLKSSATTSVRRTLSLLLCPKP